MEIIQDVLLDNINQLIHQDLNLIVEEIFYFLIFQLDALWNWVQRLEFGYKKRTIMVKDWKCGINNLLSHFQLIDGEKRGPGRILSQFFDTFLDKLQMANLLFILSKTELVVREFYKLS